MGIKIVYTFCFLAIAALILFLGNKLIQDSLVQIRKRKTSFLKTSLLSSLILTMFFVQYCLLTQTPFPFMILLLLIAATLAGYLFNEIISSVAGVSIKETRQKVNVMYTAMAFEQTINQPSKYWIMSFSSIILFGSWIAALWIFWSMPIGSPEANVWVALFIFITPQINNIVINLNSITPIVASEYIDDDLRNSSLSSNFSSIIASTIYFIFPFFVLNQTTSVSFSWLPPYWVIILIPLVSFVFFGIIPFFIGVYKFRNQNRYFLEWLHNWLQELNNSVLFADEEKKLSKMAELETEMNTRISENKMYRFLKELKVDTLAAKTKLTQAEQVFQIFNNYKDDITRWDLQLAFIQKLKDTKHFIENAKDETEVKNYIASRVGELNSELEKLDKSKNKMAGILTSLFTGIIGILLKTYQSDLLALLERFKPH